MSSTQPSFNNEGTINPLGLPFRHDNGKTSYGGTAKIKDVEIKLGNH